MHLLVLLRLRDGPLDPAGCMMAGLMCTRTTSRLVLLARSCHGSWYDGIMSLKFALHVTWKQYIRATVAWATANAMLNIHRDCCFLNSNVPSFASSSTAGSL